MFDDSDDKDLAKASTHLLRGANSGMVFKASLTALGEALKHSYQDANMCHACADSLHRQMSSRKIEIYGYGRREDPNVFVYANELIGRDELLQRADALILATALTDADCSTLFTTDRILLESMNLGRYIEELREVRGRPLSIVEPFLDGLERRRGSRRISRRSPGH